MKDIKRFSTVWKFLAYCGVAPITYSSGSFNIKRTTSKVNKELKRILYMASVGLLRNKKYREIYDKKIKEGKHHFLAISHVAKRIAKKLYKEWKKLESY
ncbi:MAG: transposase [Nanoarchaeota archaeon]